MKQAARWLLEHGVETVFVGDMSDVLDTLWSAEVNQKTHNFWSHSQLSDRLEHTFDLGGLDLVEVPEFDTSSTCPRCGSENVTRYEDEFSCDECHVEAHADIVGAAVILAENEDVRVSDWFGPMARPAAPSAGRLRDGDHEDTYSSGTTTSGHQPSK